MNSKKRFLIIFISSIIILLFNKNCFALTMSEMNSQASSWISTGEASSGDLDPVLNKVTEEFTDLGQILTFIGTGIMVAATAYMGIKYMISPPDKQAALKQQLIGLVVSGIVIFGAYGIWKLVIEIVNKF